MANLDASTLVSGAPKVGDLIAGKYRVESVLGSGGMGIVLLATHLDLEERVAIKLLLPQVSQSQETVARFLREARAAIKIRSEHVVRILDVGRLEGGAPYMVMEYLDGRDLAHVVAKTGPFSVQVAVDYLLQACEALAEAHALGIVHRDLKPANLFLTQFAGGVACVKVLDFGISKVAADSNPGSPARDAITTTTAILGTPSYMSPEQMRSTRDVDARADIWSLGAILYALLSGAPPYQGESTADVCAKIIRDPPPWLHEVRPDAPPALAHVIARCLAKEPAERYANVAELAAALVDFGSVEAKTSLARVVNVLAPRRPSYAPDAAQSSGASGPPAAAAQVTAGLHVVAAQSEPTRTASAWEGAKQPSQQRTGGRRFALLVATALAGAAVAVGGMLVLSGSMRGTARGVATASGVAPGVLGPASTVSAPPAPSAQASASAPSAPNGRPASAGSTAVTDATASSAPTSASMLPPRVKPGPPHVAPNKPPPQAPVPSAGGVFDDRK